MSKNRLELRRMAEAAERAEKTGATPAKKTTKKRKTKARKTATRRTKEKTLARRRIVWCIYNGSMKEEARFPYDQRDAAEEKLQALQAKATKKLYFLQPLKEVLSDAAVTEDEVPEEIEAVVPDDDEDTTADVNATDDDDDADDDEDADTDSDDDEDDDSDDD